MAAYFIDSSALAKIYHPELGTSRLDQILDEPARRIIISRLTLVELRPVFAIKARTGVLAKADAFSSLSRFDQDQASGIFDVIAFRESDFGQAERLMEMYAFDLRLRTLIPDGKLGSCQAPGFVQWAAVNPARSGRKQR